jgi:hypothetical protein
MKKLYFLSRLDGNLGDYQSCPLRHFAFNGFETINLDILKYQAIEPSVPVILGGGGLIANHFSVHVMKALAAMPNPIYAWGIGHNDHSYKPGDCIRYPDWLNRFVRVGIRDNDGPYPFVPCPSCMSPLFDCKRDVRWPLGIYAHRSARTIPSSVKKVTSACMANTCRRLEDALNFIGACEVVVTDSYHGMYWAALLCKPTIVFPHSSKFFLTPFPAAIGGGIEEAITKASHFKGMLAQHRRISTQFYSEILGALSCESNQGRGSFAQWSDRRPLSDENG